MDRFWQKVDKSGSCWNWKGSKNKKGYGSFFLSKSKPVGAHRYSYKMHFGEFKAALFVCHKCDNPSCVRPDHLFLGTPTDNMRDAKEKGRLSKVFCVKGIHKLLENNLLLDKRGRRCRECNNAERRANYWKHHAEWRKKNNAYEASRGWK